MNEIPHRRRALASLCQAHGTNLVLHVEAVLLNSFFIAPVPAFAKDLKSCCQSFLCHCIVAILVRIKNCCSCLLLLPEQSSSTQRAPRGQLCGFSLLLLFAHLGTREKPLLLFGQPKALAAVGFKWVIKYSSWLSLSHRLCFWV